MSVRRAGLPEMVKMRHNAHYVEEIISRNGTAIGRMIPIEQIQANPEHPRKDHGDLRGLTDSVREKGVLKPLLVRHLPETGRYMIISGERRYLAARAAGLIEVPCIEKTADEAETLELALVENLQRKDLTPFEEANGIQALGERSGLTHEEIARKIGKSRSSVTETLSRLEQEKAARNSPPERDPLGAQARNPESRPQSRPTKRSSRLPVLIPIKIKGNDTGGQVFEEDSRTIVVADRSILITMTHEVALGAEIGIENLALGHSSRGRVVWRSGETNEVGVYLSDVEQICGVKLTQDHDL